MTVEQAISDISALPVDDQLRVARYTANPSTLMTVEQRRERMRAFRVGVRF